MMMIYEKLDIEERGENIVVVVEVPHEAKGGKDQIPRIRVETKDVVSILKEKGISHGDVIEGATVKNWREHTRKGTWIFEKKKLDKSAEKVILDKEETPALKKKKSRAKKKTSK